MIKNWPRFLILEIDKITNQEPIRRTYQDLWETIREKRHALVEVHPARIDRVVKAVMKEKSQDYAFKLLNTHDSFRLEIIRDRSKGVIEFKLKAKYGLEDIVKVE